LAASTIHDLIVNKVQKTSDKWVIIRYVIRYTTTPIIRKRRCHFLPIAEAAFLF
jgi:hypothetical protein